MHEAGSSSDVRLQERAEVERLAAGVRELRLRDRKEVERESNEPRAVDQEFEVDYDADDVGSDQDTYAQPDVKVKDENQ